MFNKFKYCSAGLAIVVVFLLGAGIIAVYSTTYAKADNGMLYKQIIWVACGIVMALGVASININLLSRCAKWILAAICCVLGYLMIVNVVNTITMSVFNFNFSAIMPFAQVRNGACRWLVLGPISIQPAEFAKFALILFFSCYYGMRDTSKVESLKDGLLIPGGVSLLLMILIVGGRSLSNCVLVCLLTLIVMYFAGVKLRMIVSSFAVLVLLAVCVIMATPFRRQRIFNYIHKNAVQETVIIGEQRRVADNYQLNRSICAIGSGGGVGLGVGKGRLKHRSIPESHTDFVFAVIGEELGFAGIGFVIFLYMAFMFFSFGIAKQCRDKRGALMCMTVGSFIPLQALMNMGVVCGLFPTTGVTAPLVSYGGSSVTSIMLCVGLVFNAVRQNGMEEQKVEDEKMDCIIVPPGGVQ